MAYTIRPTGNSFQVVCTINGGKTVVRVLDTFTYRDDAERMLADLAGWRFSR